MSKSLLSRLKSTECPMCFEAPSGDPSEPEASIVYSEAHGCNIIDVDGNRYVDLAASFGAILLGHLAQRPSRALEMQSHRLWAGLGDVYASDAKIAMIEAVASLYPRPGARVLLCQSGSDAVTAALKTALLNTGRPGILAFDGAYHGLGYGPLAACGYKSSFREPFQGQLNQQVVFAPYPAEKEDLDQSLDVIRQLLACHPIGAVLVEPVLGRGGCVVPPADFLPSLAKLAEQSGALLIADEIWTGLGRCGAMLACSRVGVVPDIVCFGKGLGGGLPISACVAPSDLMRAWKDRPGVVHTSTFQGNALACSTGVALIEAIRSGNLAERADQVGAVFMATLRERLAGKVGFRQVTGTGLMVGIALESGALAAAVCRDLLCRGYIVVTGGQRAEVLTITPALTIGQDLLDGFVGAMVEVLEARAAHE
jgi:4-aminobutyrate aminotransferase/(S)-3-amino-2-methylpropionate transaminase